MINKYLALFALAFLSPPLAGAATPQGFCESVFMGNETALVQELQDLSIELIEAEGPRNQGRLLNRIWFQLNHEWNIPWFDAASLIQGVAEHQRLIDVIGTRTDNPEVEAAIPAAAEAFDRYLDQVRR